MSLIWPLTLAELQVNGYTKASLTEDSSRSCNLPIQFWTSPTGGQVPLDRCGESFNPHWLMCLFELRVHAKLLTEMLARANEAITDVSTNGIKDRYPV